MAIVEKLGIRHESRGQKEKQIQRKCRSRSHSQSGNKQ